MQKLTMYIILGATMTIGGYIPVLFGANALGGWSILGGLIGGAIGIWIYYKVRQSGYIE